VKEYRDNAQCRDIAHKMQRARLEDMAKAWDRLARSREDKVCAGARRFVSISEISRGRSLCGPI